ncbi:MULTISPECIES: hypothetical protein [Streptomyces]|uniref:Uncharacterized protein n=1 Tax=Streptomyces hokutonensis TaxID=1306990 RepID=A0ABW6M7A1_9ACTN|nr:hypothetical protein OG504_39235 [Streptomyces sp. NBC_00986]
MGSGSVSIRSLRAAVALVTAQAAGLEVSQAELLDGCPADEALATLTLLVAGAVGTAPVLGAAMLRSVGESVAREAARGEGGG